MTESKSRGSQTRMKPNIFPSPTDGHYSYDSIWTL